MPLNDRKIISIILDQCSEVEERCVGYRDEIVEVICDIVDYEHTHQVSATNIQKKINDKFNAAARFLAAQRDHDVSAEDVAS